MERLGGRLKRCELTAGKPAAGVPTVPPSASPPLVQFDPLSPQQLREVARLQLAGINARLKDRSITMEMTGGLFSWGVAACCLPLQLLLAGALCAAGPQLAAAGVPRGVHPALPCSP